MFMCGLSAVMLLCGVCIQTAMAATEPQKLAAVQGGLAHLGYVQCTTAGANFGSFAYGDTSNTSCGSTYADAFTGMSLFAFLARTADWPAAGTYNTAVANAAAYLLSIASTGSVSTNADGVNICPGGSGNCMAIYWNESGNIVYGTGFIAQGLGAFAATQGGSAVATTSGPLHNLTWTQILQGISNAFAASQAGAGAGNLNGGWRYTLPTAGYDGDMSTTQWGAVASGYDEAVGATTASFVKPHLRIWLAADVDSVGAHYQPGYYGPTFGESGGWLVTASYSGMPFSSVVVGWMNTKWKTDANGDQTGTGSYGHFGNPYGMWAAYKGIGAFFGLADTTHITNLLTDCGVAEGQGPQPASFSGGVCNWWEDYNEWLVNGTASYPAAIPNTQISTDGGSNKYWTGTSSYPDPLSTAVDVSIIAAAPLPATIAPPPTTTVPALSMWGLVALGILLAGFAAMRLRKAHPRQS